MQVIGWPVTDEQRHALGTDAMEVLQALFTVNGFWNQFQREQRQRAGYWPVCFNNASVGCPPSHAGRLQCIRLSDRSEPVQRGTDPMIKHWPP